jgi:putative peptidoglycan lipid II flippase
MVKNLIKNGKLLILRRQTNILSAAFIIMVAYAASGLLGLLRNRLLAATFFGGRESQLDAYFAAFVIPDTLFQLLITGALSAAFIPVFSQYLKRDESEASQLASTSINVFTAIFLILIIIVFLFSSSLSQLIAPSLKSQDLYLLSNLLRIMLLAQIFFAFSGFITAIIQSHQRFLIPALSPVVYNLGIITGILFLSSSLGIYGPAIGVVIGAVFHFLIQIPLARKLGFSYNFSFEFSHPGLKQIRRLMPPRSLTLAVGQVERFIAVSIATSLAAGSLTIFNFARQLYLLPITLFGTTIGQASFPTLSSEIASEKRKEFQATLTSTLLQVLYFSLPVAVIILILRVPVVRIAFGARNFPWEATLLTSRTVAFLAVAIPSLSLTSVLNRAFYALHDTKTPLIIAAISAALTIIFSISFAKSAGLGVVGLAIALAIANSVQALILLSELHRKLKIITSKLIFSIVKIIIATITTGVFLWVPMRVIDRYILDTTRTINLLILTISVLTIGMFVYLNLSAVLRIEQLSEIIALGRKIGNWKAALRKSEEMLESTSLEKPVN